MINDQIKPAEAWKNDATNLTSKATKLLYIIGRYPELTTTFIEREIKILRQQGDIELQTVSIRRPETLAATLPEYKDIRDNTIYITPVVWLTFVVANLYFILRRPVVYISTFFYLFVHEHPDLKNRLMTILHFGLGVYTAYVLKDKDFDHIHVHFIDRAVVIALIMSRFLGKTYSLTAHANSIFVKKILIKEKIINAKFMVTVSQHNKAHLLTNYAGLDPDKIHILHPWVDMAHFVPPTKRLSQSTLRIFSVGRLVEKKGHTYLIDACHQLQKQGINFQCRIAGEGPLKAALEARINQYNLQDRVCLMGGQPQQEVLSLLASWADVFVLPCVIAKDGDRDGIPVSLAEAMAMELPVVSTNIVGISELVQPGTGLLVPPQDPLALTEALQTIYATDNSSRAAMGSRGRAIVDSEFNLLTGTLQLADLFRKIKEY